MVPGSCFLNWVSGVKFGCFFRNVILQQNDFLTPFCTFGPRFIKKRLPRPVFIPGSHISGLPSHGFGRTQNANLVPGSWFLNCPRFDFCVFGLRPVGPRFMVSRLGHVEGFEPTPGLDPRRFRGSQFKTRFTILLNCVAYSRDCLPATEGPEVFGGHRKVFGCPSEQALCTGNYHTY